MARTDYLYARRAYWTREDWIVAYDSCPKTNQSYGPDAPFVCEVADLLGRTPAAVSRAFGNLWAAQTAGKRGLKHYSHLAEEVVEEFRSDLSRLHAEASRIRLERIPVALTPRLELRSRTDESPLDEAVVHQAAKDSGLNPKFYFVTTRPGSVVVDIGILLEVLLIGVTGWGAVAETIRLIRDQVDRKYQGLRGHVVLVANRSWREIESGKTRTVEERIFASYLPGFPRDRLARDSRSRLAGFLAFIRGVRRRQRVRRPNMETSLRHGSTVGRPFTRATLERLLGLDLSAVSDESLKQLSDLVKVVRTTEFAKALRTTRRTARSRRHSS